MSQVIIAVIVTGVIVAAITWVVANQHRQKTYESEDWKRRRTIQGNNR